MDHLAHQPLVLYLLFILASIESFQVPPPVPSLQYTHKQTLLQSTSSQNELLQQEASKQFKILTCSATSCSKQRKLLGMDAFATYGAFYSRIQEGMFPLVELEEVSCLGACQQAPCVAVQHEDYEGTVALEGMNENEFEQRVFHGVISDLDADRIWEAVQSAIKQMAEQDDDEDDDDEEYMKDETYDESRFV